MRTLIPKLDPAAPFSKLAKISLVYGVLRTWSFITWCSSPLLRFHRRQITQHHLCQAHASSFRVVVCSCFIIHPWFVSYFWSLWCSATSRLSSDLPEFEPFDFGLSDLWALWPSWSSLDHFPTSCGLIPIQSTLDLCLFFLALYPFWAFACSEGTPKEQMSAQPHYLTNQFGMLLFILQPLPPPPDSR